MMRPGMLKSLRKTVASGELVLAIGEDGSLGNDLLEAAEEGVELTASLARVTAERDALSARVLELEQLRDEYAGNWNKAEARCEELTVALMKIARLSLGDDLDWAEEEHVEMHKGDIAIARAALTPPTDGGAKEGT